MLDPTKTAQVVDALDAPPPPTRLLIAWYVFIGVLCLVVGLIGWKGSSAEWVDVVIGVLCLCLAGFLSWKRHRTLVALAEAVALLEAWQKGDPS